MYQLQAVIREAHSETMQGSHRQPIDAAQKIHTNRSKSTLRLPDGRERYSVYSSHKSFEGNDALKSVYST